MSYPEADRIKKIVNDAEKIVIIQADNPDADSLGSALALEHILGDIGKKPQLYCGVDMPTYLRYMSGWDRVQSDLPSQFDASIIVDASTMTLLEKLSLSGRQGWVAGKPCVVLDHHQTVENVVPFASVMINDFTRASTGELIYMLAKQLDWPLSVDSQNYITSSILGDTQGLTNQLASAETYKIMATMIEAGVNRPQLEELRREYGKMPPEIYRYKADLIKRTEFGAAGQIASVTISQNEITKFSPLYNPAPLIQGDMLQTSGVRVAIVFKQYADGKITGAIRTNPSAGIAAELAEHLGGGGHAFASGFKVGAGRAFDDVKPDALNYASELLAKIDNESNEAV
jgi:phosphoesterase RecJ-like protein